MIELGDVAEKLLAECEGSGVHPVRATDFDDGLHGLRFFGQGFFERFDLLAGGGCAVLVAAGLSLQFRGFSVELLLALDDLSGF